MSDRTLLVIAALLFGAVVLATTNCASHEQYAVNASMTTKITEPVAVPRSTWWRAVPIVVPTTGGLVSPPGVTPLPPDPKDPGFYFEGGTTYGPPQPKTTETGLGVKAEGEKDKKPEIPSLLGMVLGHWSWALGAAAVVAILALVGFRKSGLVQGLAKFLPFPFSLLRLPL